jgi:hypothetical protein
VKVNKGEIIRDWILVLSVAVAVEMISVVVVVELVRGCV